MADFGDYAAPYLTMARQAPETVDRLTRLGQSMQEAPIRRRAMESEAAMAEEKARYAPQMLMAELYGSPFQREKFAVEQRQSQTAAQRAQLNTDRLLAQQAEQMRRNAVTEKQAGERQSLANRTAAYNAALKAYEMGVGPHPGPFPTAGTGQQGLTQVSPGMGPQGADQQPAPTQPMKIPEDLMQLPPGMRNKAWGERIAQKSQTISEMQSLFSDLDVMEQQARALTSHKGMPLATGWTGLVAGKVPDVTQEGALDFTDRLEALKTGAGLNVLQTLRRTSENGASGLGQVTNLEHAMLQKSFAPLSTLKTTDDVKRALREVANRTELIKKNIRDQYKRAYGEELPKFQTPNVIEPNPSEKGRQTAQENELIFNGYRFPSKEKLEEYRRAIGG